MEGVPREVSQVRELQPPLAVRVDEAARLLAVSTHHLRNLIDSRQLRAVRSGRILLVPVDSLISYLNDHVIDGE